MARGKLVMTLSCQLLINIIYWTRANLMLAFFVNNFQEQAQAQGWNKANKLEGRNTKQGLIGACLSSDERTATLVELNSETDFVARNNQFHSLLNNIIAIVTEQANKRSG